MFIFTPLRLLAPICLALLLLFSNAVEACTCAPIGVMLAHDGVFNLMDEGYDDSPVRVPQDPHLWVWVRVKDPGDSTPTPLPLQATFLSKDGSTSIPAEVLKEVKGGEVNLEVLLHPTRRLPAGTTWRLHIERSSWGPELGWRSPPLKVVRRIRYANAPSTLSATTDFVEDPEIWMTSCGDHGNVLTVGAPTIDIKGSLITWEAVLHVVNGNVVNLVVPGGPLGFELRDQGCSTDPFLMQMRAYTPWPINAYVRPWPFDGVVDRVSVRRLGPEGEEGPWQVLPVIHGNPRPERLGGAAVKGFELLPPPEPPAIQTVFE